MSDTPKKFYLTTPIYYVNARPHIGHAYTTIVADVLARRHRLLGDDTFFLTGTDEHGQKIERSAEKAGIPPQQLADEVSIQFRNLWDRMGLTYDRYIRTTDPKHKRGAQKLFADLYAAGHIYLDSYTGQYSIGEEMFVEGPPGTIGPDGKPTETVTEENFFFRLSAFQRPLIDLIESDTLAITPESRKNEVMGFLRGNVSAAPAIPAENVILSETKDLLSSEAPQTLAYSTLGNPYIPGAVRDLSVSRSSFTWGIPVPEPAASASAQKHVIYVWLDALANYMTALGYGSDDPADQAEFQKHWPADLHLVGKEIIRFHCVYWPAFLLALNPELQRRPSTTHPNSVIERESQSSIHPQSVILSEGAESHPAPQPKDLQSPRPAPIAKTLSTTEPSASPQLSLEQHQQWAAKWLPKAVTAHGWLLFDNSKMSKSKGNIVRTETILDGFGDHVYAKQFPDSTKQERDLFASDVLRYFLLREIPFGQDGSFSFDALITRYNADLANGYGNLVSRTLSMIARYRENTIPVRPQLVRQTGDPIFSISLESIGIPSSILISKLEDFFRKNDFANYLLESYKFIAETDEFISRWAPWKIASSESPSKDAELDHVLYTAAESIRIITLLLHPVLPDATVKVWDMLGLADTPLITKNSQLTTLTWGGLKPGTKLGPLAPIFPRADKGLTQIMTDMENPTQNSPLETENSRPESPLKSAATPAPAQPVATNPTDPAAPPRSGSAPEPTSPLPVGGSDATSTHNGPSPSHKDAQASGIFAATTETPQITIDDFIKIELRVAQITVAERIPKADKLLRLEVDLGPDFPPRQILSGIAEFYTPEELIGRRIVVITNLAPRKMRGLESHGMLLAASHGENGKPVLATFSEDIALGSRLK